MVDASTTTAGVDDADLEAFDRVLLDLDVHCRQHK